MSHGTWRQWADKVKQNTYALYLASKDKRVPLLAKLMIGLVVAYALSPIDLIPDFIPVIGYLDDLLLLPFGIWLAIRLVPKDVWMECQSRAKEKTENLPGNRRAATIIILVWILVLAVITIWIVDVEWVFK